MPNIRTTTDLTWSAAAARRAPELLRVAGFGLLVLVLEVALARGVSGPEISRYVYLFVGVFVLAFVFRFPLATALVLFFFTDFLFAATKFSGSVGSITVRPPEVALACIFLLALVRPKRDTWGGPAGAALAVFLALAAVSALIAVKTGATSLSDAFNWGRPLALLTLFYVVVRLFPGTEERRRLLIGIAILAAVTGLFSLMISVGIGFAESLGEQSGIGEVSGEAGTVGVQRIRLAGLSACYGLFWFAAVQVIAHERFRRIAWAAIVAGMVASIVLSYNRNMWLGIVIGAGLIAVLGGRLVRGRMTIGLAVLAAGIVVVLLFGGRSADQGVVKPLLKRGSSILKIGSTERESSLQERAHETKEAWATAKDHLVIGVGAGAPFGVYDTEAIVSGSFSVGEVTSPQLFLHNQYIYLILISGVPGLIAFLIFLAVPLTEALRRSPRDPAITACAVGLAMILISSVVAIYLTVPDMTGLIGVLAGVIIADREGVARDGLPAGLSPSLESAGESLPKFVDRPPRALNSRVSRSF